MGIPTDINQFPFPRIVEQTEDMHESEEGRSRWLAIRKNYIGGSEAAAALGVSRYQSRIELFLQKTGKLSDKADSDRMWAGRMVEPAIAEMFAQRTGKHVVRQPYFYCHPDHLYMGANIDFGIFGENAGLECKNTTNKIDYVDGNVPDENFIQVQHYLAVTGASRWYLAYLMDGWDFHYVVIERDEEFIQMMIAGEREFWVNHVMAGVTPEFDGSESASRMLGYLYPKELEVPHDPAELPDDIDSMWDEENEITAQISDLDKRRTEIRNQISALIGEKASGLSSKYAFTYKTVNRSGYAVEPRSYRQLRGRVRKEAK